MAGRKSLKEEIKIVERMSALSEPVFDYLFLCVSAGDKADKQWATEQMMKLYAKAVPTEITGDSEHPIPIMQVTFSNVSTNDSNQEVTSDVQEDPGSTGGNVS